MKTLHIVTFLLVVIGGLNWGLVGISPNYNLVAAIFGTWPIIEQVVYILVGVSTVYLVVTHKKDCRTCSVEEMK